MKVRIESKSQSSVSTSSILDVLIVDFNKMNSFAYDSSHSDCFDFNKDENEDMVPKDLIKAV